MSLRKISRVIIILLLFSLLSNDKFQLSKVWFYLSDIILLFLVLIFVIRISRLQKIYNYSFFIFLILILFLSMSILISYFFHSNFEKSLKYLYVYSIFYIIYILCKELGFNKIEWFIVWSILLSIIIILSFLRGGYTWVYRYQDIEIMRKEITSGFGQSNTLVYPLSFASFLSLNYLRYIKSRKIKLIIILTIAIQFISILLILSRSGIILISLLSFYFFIESLKDVRIKRWIIYIILAAITYPLYRDLLEMNLKRLFLSLPTDIILNNEFSRLNLWKMAISIFREYPLTGIGFANIGAPLGIWDRDIQVHNIFLEMLSGIGILGSTIYFILLFFVIRDIFYLKGKYKEIIFLVFLVLFSYMVEPIYGSHHFAIFLGIYLASLLNFYKSLR